MIFCALIFLSLQFEDPDIYAFEQSDLFISLIIYLPFIFVLFWFWVQGIFLSIINNEESKRKIYFHFSIIIVFLIYSSPFIFYLISDENTDIESFAFMVGPYAGFFTFILGLYISIFLSKSLVKAESKNSDIEKAFLVIKK